MIQKLNRVSSLLAITYGLLDDKTANGVMDHLLAKMQSVESAVKGSANSAGIETRNRSSSVR